MAVKLIAGNWKMYKSVAETRSFLQAVMVQKQEFSAADLAVFAQGPLLPIIESEWKSLGGGEWFSFGPQNVHWEERGAFTGELSAKLAREMGSTYALAGHSERRQFFGETNETAAKRALAAHNFGMRAIFCVGEQLAERDSGATFEVLKAQCQALFSLAPKAPEGISFAYEPVWAIGTGRTATAIQAQEAHAFLRQQMMAAWGEKSAGAVRILYGGSVKPENAAELMSQRDVDGVLVGGASLEPASFLAIAAAGKQ